MVRHAVLASALFLAACGGPPPTPPAASAGDGRAAETTVPAPASFDGSTAMRLVPPERLPPLWDDAGAADGWASLRLALERNRRWLRGRPPDRIYTYGPRRATGEELRRGLDRLLRWLDEGPTAESFAARVVRHFDVLESVGTNGDDGRMLVTGYYEPLMEGSLRRTAEYDIPVYGPPGNLIRVDLGAFDDAWRGKRIAGLLRGSKLVPFPDRRGIREGTAMRGREIAWVKDPVDLFFVEVQGSGALLLPDGREQRIGYAGANGRPYRSIGKLLIDQGKVPRERMSMQAIRDYLARHPEELHDVLDYNPSVVFFRKLDGPPVGALGVPVTPGRSVAVDLRLFPRGAFGFLVTEMPAPGPDGERPWWRGPSPASWWRRTPAVLSAGRVGRISSGGVGTTRRGGPA
ncbi:MAG: MltA domain-containing protein [Acidobacteriota bacterium]